MRGNIFIYQGEELGLPQSPIAFDELRDPEAIANWPLTLGRDGARTPMPWVANAGAAGRVKTWLPIPAEHLALAADVQERDPGSQLAYTRRVLALRNRSEALATGTIRVLEASESILAFERSAAGQRMLCVFNLSMQARSWQPPDGGRWRIVERAGAVEDWMLPALSGAVAQREA
jgi:alpha-glucosidase